MGGNISKQLYELLNKRFTYGNYCQTEQVPPKATRVTSETVKNNIDKI